MRKLKNVLYSVVIFFLVSLILLLGGPKLFGIRTLVVESGSMSPTYNVGDLVYAVPTDFEEVKKGDVITYVLNEDLVLSTHRIIGIDQENQEFYTKGDANELEDGAPVLYANVQGVVRFAIPKIGYVWMALQQTFWRIIAGTFMAALIILMLLLKALSQGEEVAQEPELENYSLPPMPPGWGKKGRAGRKVFMLIGGAGLCSIAGTLAFLTIFTNAVDNKVGLGRTPIEVTENLKKDPDTDGILWGEDTKEVKVTSIKTDKTTDSVIRVMIVPMFKDKDSGDYIEVPFSALSEPTGDTLEIDDFIFHFSNTWASEWFYKDGFFYYRDVVEPGDQTSTLLTGVTLKSDADLSIYEDVKVEIEVLADSIQADGGAPEQEWNVNVNSGVVTP